MSTIRTNLLSLKSRRPIYLSCVYIFVVVVGKESMIYPFGQQKKETKEKELNRYILLIFLFCFVQLVLFQLLLLFFLVVLLFLFSCCYCRFVLAFFVYFCW